LNETVTNALGTLYTMIFFDDDDFEPEFNAYLTDPKTYVKELMGMQQNAIIMKKCSASEKFIESLKTKVILELPDADEDLI
jgi:hypothetical protein